MIRPILLLAALMYLLPFLAFSQDLKKAVRESHFNLENERTALYGYDPVSYFQDSEPQKGNEDIRYTYKGVTYRFASAENREAFKSSPAKYEPAYGGWCAYTMGAKGEKVEPDPENYKIYQGELHVFFNGFLSNAKKKWNRDEENLKKRADENWSEMVSGQ